jgi:glycosyltransferase involved in cell wall biosynthesis
VTNLATARQERPAATADRWLGCVSVIIPVYNEAAHVDEILEAVHASPVKKEITIVFHEKNCGKGAAVRTALTYARGEYVLIQDSDLEYDPQDYAALLGPLEESKADIVYGMRPDRPGRGLRFFLGAKLLTLLTNLLYGAGIHDEATCYKVFRRSLLAQIHLECQRFEFCPEVTAKLCRMGKKIAEVPISYHPRSAGEGKKIRPSDGWLAIWTLIRYRFSSRNQWMRQTPDVPSRPPFPVSFSRLSPE